MDKRNGIKIVQRQTGFLNRVAAGNWERWGYEGRVVGSGDEEGIRVLRYIYTVRVK